MNTNRRTRTRLCVTVLLSALFLAATPGSAAASIGSIDLLELLGLKPPRVQVAPPPVTVPAADPIPAPPVAAAGPAVTAPDPAAAAVPPNSGSGRRVVYSVPAQRVWLVNADETVHGTWLVSGRRGEPNPGTYSVFSRSRHARAKAPGITMEFMVRFVRTSGLPIGFHSIPVNRRGAQIQTVEELGTYQSLGCVRQRYEDAVVMWEFAQIGTPVVVL